MSLTTEKCIACRADAPRVTVEEIQELKPQIPDWQLYDPDAILQLERVFQLRNFAESLAFANRVAEFAEAEGHHPAILIEWGRCTVRWWTHKIRGLHRNDFISAAKTDRIWDQFSRERAAA